MNSFKIRQEYFISSVENSEIKKKKKKNKSRCFALFVSRKHDSIFNVMVNND